jgi:hypothetical protein
MTDTRRTVEERSADWFNRTHPEYASRAEGLKSLSIFRGICRVGYERQLEHRASRMYWAGVKRKVKEWWQK